MVCKACGGDPLACHCDGNFKNYRLESEQGEQHESLNEDAAIAADEKVEEHSAKLDGALKRRSEKNTEKSNQHDTCGGALYKAARSDSSRFKGLDVTGIIVCSCRHEVVLAAANMFVGETYKHTHFIHNFVANKGYKFLSSDVSCNYTQFANRVGDVLEEYRKVAEETIPFLGLLHGKTHLWTCQILFNGAWKEGIAHSDGEHSERVFSRMSLYGNVTKHMSRAGRRDFLTSAIFYWNSEKEEKMPSDLKRRLVVAKKRIRDYDTKLQKLLVSRGLSENDLPQIKEKLIAVAKECHGKRSATGMPLALAQQSVEGHYMVTQILKQRIKTVAYSCKERTIFRRKISEHKARSIKLIRSINEFVLRKELLKTPTVASKTKSQPEKADDNKTNYVDESHFESGKFPWLPSSTETFQNDYEIVNVWMLRERCAEEIARVPKEMAEFLRSLQTVARRLEKDVNSTADQINTADDFQLGRAAIAFSELRRIRAFLAKAIEDIGDDLSDEELLNSCYLDDEQTNDGDSSDDEGEMVQEQEDASNEIEDIVIEDDDNSGITNDKADNEGVILF